MSRKGKFIEIEVLMGDFLGQKIEILAHVNDQGGLSRVMKFLK